MKNAVTGFCIVSYFRCYRGISVDTLVNHENSASIVGLRPGSEPTTIRMWITCTENAEMWRGLNLFWDLSNGWLLMRFWLSLASLIHRPWVRIN